MKPAAGVIATNPTTIPAAAPYPMGNRRIDDDRPERDEGDVRTEPHPLDDRAGDQRRGDDRERALIGEEQNVGDRSIRLEANAAQKQIIAAAPPHGSVTES